MPRKNRTAEEIAAIPCVSIEHQRLSMRENKLAYEQANTDAYYQRRGEIPEDHADFLLENVLSTVVSSNRKTGPVGGRAVGDGGRDRSSARPVEPRVPADATGLFDHEYDLRSIKLIRPTGYDFSMFVPPRYAHHYVSNTYEAASGRLVQRLARGANLFIDIGAHCGFYSLLAASANPALDIIAVEPTPETSDILRKNVETAQAQNVVVRQAAASSSGGKIELFKSAASDNCGPYLHPAAPSVGKFEVQATTIDDLVGEKRPKRLLVKMDAEGHEPAILRGMAQTLANVADVRLLIELNPLMLDCAHSSAAQLLDLLDELGFVSFVVDEASGTMARATRSSPVVRRMAGSDYANIYCLRKSATLSVAFFSHSSQLGGAERHLLDLVTELISDHNVVANVVVPGDGPLVQKLSEAGAGCVVVPELCWWASAGEAWGPDDGARLSKAAEALMMRLLPAINDIQPDLVFTQTIVNPWGAAVAAIQQLPHIWSICEFGEADHGLKFAAGLQATLTQIRDGATSIVTNSNAVAQTLFPDLGAGRVRTVYQHIEIPATPEPVGQGASPPSPWRERGAVKLGLFATLTPSKGQADAIRAVASLCGLGRTTELVLVGNDFSGYREELERLATDLDVRDLVHFVGFRADPFPLMRDVDIVLVCSRQEAFGRTAVEAMLLSKPVVYARAGGLQELMIEGETGLSFSFGDVRELAEGIEELCRSPERRDQIGKRGRAHALASFTRDAFSGEIFRLMRQHLDQPRTGPRAPTTVVDQIAQAGRSINSEREALLSEREALRGELMGAAKQEGLLTRQLEAMLNSTSWRMTQPVRTVGSQLVKLRGPAN